MSDLKTVASRNMIGSLGRHYWFRAGSPMIVLLAVILNGDLTGVDYRDDIVVDRETDTLLLPPG